MSSSQLVESPAIGDYNIQRCDKNRTLVINRIKVIAFTPTEYKLLLPLLSGQLIRDDDLINEAFGSNIKQWNRDNLSKYIDKLRCKVRSAGLDVCRMNKYGYMLLAK